MPPKKWTKVPPNLSRRINSEKAIAQNLLNGFISKGSRGEKLIEEIIGCPLNKITLTGLIRVSNIISSLIDVKINRNYTRKKALIVKWFQDNEHLITPIKNNLQVVYDNGITESKQESNQNENIKKKQN